MEIINFLKKFQKRQGVTLFCQFGFAGEGKIPAKGIEKLEAKENTKQFRGQLITSS